ncbi:ATP-binding cassette domain-containing protein [Longispora albida]|uniref:ATP-binding cassette domain-containing protein n=1 Tax=Longispora albida TaxID=203523 RepID=UPI00037D0B2A|nr:ATP-binding cassette domain-containing protein [Longispora albida]
MAAVIEIEGLRKTYRTLRRGEHRALDGLDLSVEAGQVHGFLGPNGCGKTTTLRTLLGLIKADSGRMRLLGRDVPAALPQVAGAIGAIVESPQFFPNFSARKTLTLLATAGGVRRSRIDEVLDMVGLTERAGDKVKGYSLGMKQRLAVASALLKEPELLILDEPANGLDPAGIREMRDLMRGLAASGVTVVLSSHILGEVQQICDSVTIVARGKRIMSGPVEQVLASQDKGEFRVRVADHRRAAEIISAAGATVDVQDEILIVKELADPSWITSTLAAHELYVAELTPLRPDLESVFLTLTDSVAAPVGVR